MTPPPEGSMLLLSLKFNWTANRRRSTDRFGPSHNLITTWDSKIIESQITTATWYTHMYIQDTRIYTCTYIHCLPEAAVEQPMYKWYTSRTAAASNVLHRLLHLLPDAAILCSSTTTTSFYLSHPWSSLNDDHMMIIWILK